MIAIDKKSVNIPQSLNNQQCFDSLKEVIDISNPEHKNKIKSEFYTADDVKIALKNLYNNKCAYCESFESEPEIEHYRPKKRVNGESRISHQGYYWLCYEWTNLLPSCHVCNKQNEKGNKFPIEGNRKYSPLFLLNGEIDLSSNEFTSIYLEDEKPLFLNPERENFDPFYYFEFDEFGVFKENQPVGTFEYRQAYTTIEIVDLNRPKLYSNYRKIKIEDIFKELKLLFFALLKENQYISPEYFEDTFINILQGIKENSNPTKEYSFFWSYLFENFPKYINRFFTAEQGIIFINIYNKFKQ